MAPALRESVSELGLTAALPGLLALATVAVAVTAATRVAGIRATTAALVTVIGGWRRGPTSGPCSAGNPSSAGSLPLRCGVAWLRWDGSPHSLRLDRSLCGALVPSRRTQAGGCQCR